MSALRLAGKFAGRRLWLSCIAIVLLLAACSSAGSPDPAPATYQPAATPLPTPLPQPTAPPLGMALRLAGWDGSAAGQVVDGNAVRVTVLLSGAAGVEREVSFALEGHRPAARCVIPAGATACSAALRADGWAWEAGKRVRSRTLVGQAQDDPALTGAVEVAVAPKPVVLVHGLNSDQMSWVNWTEPGGYLAQVELPGFAVDDEQFGTRRMNTGSAKRPLAPTLSIAENAAILAEYIEAVRLNTGAERIDLVGHSLGGLISRYYIQNLMPVLVADSLPDLPAVNQLVIAGTPNGGTACGRPAAALRLLSPATSQITPEYLTQVFNPAVRDHRGVPFFAFAGDAIKSSAIRCSGLPNDSLVSVDSVLHSIPVMAERFEATHTDLNSSRASFDRVFRLLARSPGGYPIAVTGETQPVENAELLVQSTLVQGGTLEVGKTVSVTIPIDVAREASFMLYAPGSTVTMRIKTVSGAILTEETPKTNPKVSFERLLEPTAPLSLGYGVIEPKAGAWEIGLTASETPPGGGPFAVMATVESDLRMTAEVSPAASAAGKPVKLSAVLASPAPAQELRAWADVRLEGDPAAAVQLSLVAREDGAYEATFVPDRPGDWTAVISLAGKDAAGNPFERLSVLGFLVGGD